MTGMAGLMAREVGRAVRYSSTINGKNCHYANGPRPVEMHIKYHPFQVQWISTNNIFCQEISLCDSTLC